MKIELDSNPQGINLISGYSDEGIVIRNTLYRNSIIVSPGEIIDGWGPANASELTVEHFTSILEDRPELMILGTGNRLIHPGNILIGEFWRHQIGIEVMDTPAACRAYNFLAGEGRLVVAALLALA